MDRSAPFPIYCIYTAQQKFSNDFNIVSGLNEYEPFDSVQINKYGDLKINVFFFVRQTMRHLVKRLWIDVTFYIM